MIGKFLIAAATAALANAQASEGLIKAIKVAKELIIVEPTTPAPVPTPMPAPRKCPAIPPPGQLTSTKTEYDTIIFSLPLNETCQRIKKTELWCTTNGSQYDLLDTVRGITRFHEVSASAFEAAPFNYGRSEDECKEITCVAISCNRQGCTDWAGHSASFGARFCFGPPPAPVVKIATPSCDPRQITALQSQLADAQDQLKKWSCVVVAQPKITGKLVTVLESDRIVLSWPSQFGASEYEVLEYSHKPSLTDPNCWLNNKEAWTLFKVQHSDSDGQKTISLKIPALDVAERQKGSYLNKVYFRIRTHNKCDGHSEYSNPVWYQQSGNKDWVRETYNDETWFEVQDSKCPDTITV